MFVLGASAGSGCLFAALVTEQVIPKQSLFTALVTEQVIQKQSSFT
jgi:hypothetical protein